MITISVSDLHLCQHCPRLYGYKLKGETNTWRIGLKGSGSLPSTHMHAIANKFFRDLSGNGNSKRRAGFIDSLNWKGTTIEDNILEFLRSEYLIPFLNEYHQQLSDDQITALALAMYRYGRWIASFLNPFINREEQPESIVNGVFQNSEVHISADYIFEDNQRITVTGRPDCLLYDMINCEPIVFELKGLKASDITRDLTQTSLYAWLVYRKTQMLPRIVVLYLEEDEPEVTYSKDLTGCAIQNLPGLFSMARDVSRNRSDIPRAADRTLCEQCPYSPRCEHDFGMDRKRYGFKKMEVLPGKNLNRMDSADTEGEEYLEKLVGVYEKFKLPVKQDGYVTGPRFIRLRIIPDIERNVSVTKLVHKAEDLQVALGLIAPPLIQPRNGYVSIDIPRRTCQPLLLSDVLIQGEQNRPLSDVAFPLGIGIDGTVFWVDLADPVMTSILVSGTSGSGKSVLLRSIILGLARSAPVGRVLFTLIDPKRVSFTDLADLPCLDGRILMDNNLVIGRLDSLIDEMEERYRQFESRLVHDIKEWNQVSPDPLTERVIIIDEYADLIIDKNSKESLETAIQRIGQKGRAAGFHLILATQRPDAKVVTGLIKANLQLKIGLKVTSQTNSKIILDTGGAEYLIGHGDMLVGGSVGLERLQGAIATKTDITRILEMYAS
ncbi:MAG: PD-(D/E)XK nuclease family protein [Methanospirillum sp.]|uniref:FtsK/SpoIIIE domain-containing protein n=1 Tax=Methanospirillum sp. TaxID=45200 RepID=UPI00236BB226|nr:FtsK/SpoIIIE domain-containing protein [Methanospirillum sp.]MDD1730133.1 PD-(D/E)XK nuclease family protein [Methanospirillum sp.]